MADKFKEQGNEHFKKQEYDEAIKAYSKGIEIDGSNAVLFANRSAAFLGAGDAAAALEDAERALQTNEAYTKGYLRKSKALVALGRPAHAEKTLKEGLEKYPDDQILKPGLQDFLLEEDGTQTPLYGYLPGTSGQNMRDLQGEQGMGMHTEHFIRALPCEALRCAYLGDVAGFNRHWKAPQHAKLRSWEVKLPITSLIVAGAQRIHLVYQGLRPRSFDHGAILKKVLDEGWCRVDARDAAGYTALAHAAGHHPKLELAEICLEYGADPSVRDRMGSTPLFNSIMSQEVDSVKMLLDAGSDPRAADHDGISLESLAQRSDTRILAMLHAKMHVHQENADVAPGANCHNPSCGKPGAIRRCSECRVALYCNRDCQRAHWKKHKKLCGKFEAEGEGDGASGSDSSRLRINVHSYWGMDSMIIPMSVISEAAAQAAGMREGTDALSRESIEAKSVKMSEARAKYAKDKNMIVKVQVPLNPMPNHSDLLIYNKTRSFQCVADGTTPVGRRLDGIIRSRGIAGQKGYFLAYMEQEGELTLIVDKMLPTQPW